MTEDLDPDVAVELELLTNRARRGLSFAEKLRRRGYLIDHQGHPYRIPDDIMDVFREEWPDLGADLPT